MLRHLNDFINLIFKIGLIVLLVILWRKEDSLHTLKTELRSSVKDSIVVHNHTVLEIPEQNYESQISKNKIDSLLTLLQTNTAPELKKPIALNFNTPRVYGIDISRYQRDIIDSISPSDSLQFVMVKATEGKTLTDRRFNYNWKETKNKGFIRGAYHFYRTSSSPTAQAKFYTRTIGKLNTYDLPPILDVESKGVNTDVVPPEQLIKDIVLWLEIVENTLEKRPIIYSELSFYKQFLNTPELQKYPIWIADYSTLESPDLDWLFWQKTDDKTIKNFKVSFSEFKGSSKDLQTFLTTL